MVILLGKHTRALHRHARRKSGSPRHDLTKDIKGYEMGFCNMSGIRGRLRKAYVSYGMQKAIY